MKQILVKNPVCQGPDCAHYRTEVLVDPVLFERFNIDRVPAFAVDPEFVYTTYCERDEPQKINAVIYGDIAFSGFLDEHERIQPLKVLKEWRAQLKSPS